jgi:hypothetical protein
MKRIKRLRAYLKNGAITGVPFILSLSKDAGDGGSASAPRTVRMFLGEALTEKKPLKKEQHF